MAVQILPGIDETIGPRLRALGEVIYAHSGLAKRRALENMLIQNPEAIQQFRDIEFLSPGTLERFGFGDLANIITKTPVSPETEIREATRGDVIPTEIAKAKSGRALSEIQQQALSKLRSQDLPEEEIGILGRQLAGVPQRSEVRQELAKSAPLGSPELESIAQFLATGNGTISPNALLVAQQSGNWNLIKERVDAIKSEIDAERELELEAAKPKSVVDRRNELLGYARIAKEQLSGVVDFPTITEIGKQLTQQFPDADQGDILYAASTAAAEPPIGRPKTAEERRLASFYVTSKPAVDRLSELEQKGVRWNRKMDLALSKLKGHTWAGYGGLITRGGIGGGFASEDIPTRVLGSATLSAMSPEEQDYFNNSLRLVEAILRPRTGLRIEGDEYNSYIRQYVPRIEETLEAVNSKRNARGLASEQLRLDAGLRPDYLQKIQSRTNIQDIQEKPEDIALETVNNALTQTRGNSEEALDNLVQTAQDNLSQGRLFNTNFNFAMNLLTRIVPVDKQISVLEGLKSSSQGIKERLSYLNNYKNKLLGKESAAQEIEKPNTKNFLDSLQQEIIKINDSLPNIRTDSARKAAIDKLKEIERLLENARMEAQIPDFENRVSQIVDFHLKMPKEQWEQSLMIAERTGVPIEIVSEAKRRLGVQ